MAGSGEIFAIFWGQEKEGDRSLMCQSQFTHFPTLGKCWVQVFSWLPLEGSSSSLASASPCQLWKLWHRVALGCLALIWSLLHHLPILAFAVVSLLCPSAWGTPSLLSLNGHPLLLLTALVGQRAEGEAAAACRLARVL